MCLLNKCQFKNSDFPRMQPKKIVVLNYLEPRIKRKYDHDARTICGKNKHDQNCGKTANNLNDRLSFTDENTRSEHSTRPRPVIRNSNWPR